MSERPLFHLWGRIKFQQPSRIVLLITVLVLGFAVRTWGADFGLPDAYHMEEPFYFKAAWNLACRGDADSSLLQPHTLLWALAIAIMHWLPIDGGCSITSDLASALLMTGRLISAAMGTLTIAVVLGIGKDLYSSSVGFIGALFVATNLLHVRESHYGTPDVTAVLLTTIALWMCVRIVKYGQLRHYVLAALATALAIVGRPTAVILVLPFVLAHLQTFGSPWQVIRTWSGFRLSLLSRRLWCYLMLVPITFLFANLQLFVNPLGFLKYWYGFVRLSDRVSYISDVLPAPLFYLRALEWGGGVLLATLMVVGVIAALRYRYVGDILLLSFVVAYFVLASTSRLYFVRYIIPIIPALSILAARTLVAAALFHNVPAIAAITVVTLFQPTAYVLRYDYLLTQTDTRTLAQKWMRANLPPGARIASEWHGPPLDDYDATVVDFYGLSQNSLNEYRTSGYDYLVVTNYIRDLALKNEVTNQTKQNFYEELSQQAELVAEFSPVAPGATVTYFVDQSLGPITSLFELERPGPMISVYRIRPD